MPLHVPGGGVVPPLEVTPPATASKPAAVPTTTATKRKPRKPKADGSGSS